MLHDISPPAARSAARASASVVGGRPGCASACMHLDEPVLIVTSNLTTRIRGSSAAYQATGRAHTPGHVRPEGGSKTWDATRGMRRCRCFVRLLL